MTSIGLKEHSGYQKVNGLDRGCSEVHSEKVLMCIFNTHNAAAFSLFISFQSCLPGYYRVDGILFGGICQPCKCNGHATECDIHGVCFVSHPSKCSVF